MTVSVQVGDDVWLGDYYGVVTDVTAPFKNGNYRDSDGNALYGREYVIFVEEDE